MPKKLTVIRDELKKYVKVDRKGKKIPSSQRSPADYPRNLKVKELELTAMLGVKTLTFKGVVKSEFPQERAKQKIDVRGKMVKAPLSYMVHIQFHNVDFQEEKDAEHEEAVKVGSKTVYFRRPRVGVNPLKLKCTCQDFRFNWEKELFDNKALIGSWRKYKRKTPPPPEGFPYANPFEYMGFCKHINSFLFHLRREELIRS